MKASPKETLMKTPSLIIAGLLLSYSLIYAGELQPALNNVVNSLDQLVAIKNNNNANPSIELEAKKTVLNRIFELSTEEVNNLIKKLTSLDQLPTDDLKSERDRFVDDLNGYKSYFDIVRGEINQKISSNEVVDIAKKLKIWREDNYQKKIDDITDFNLVFQNQSTVKIAENRFYRINRDFKAIKSMMQQAKRNRADQLLEGAKKKIDVAYKLNNKAQKFPDTLESLVKESNQSIVEAYKNFIAISDLLNNNPR